MKKLERSLSLPYVIAIAIGGMLGSGIFVLPGLAAAKTGPSVWLAYLLAGLCILPAVFSKSELATAMPTSGGTYVYIERTFGPIMGTISGIGLWLSLLLKSAFALVGFGAYLLIMADLPLKPTALLFLGVIFLLNMVGAKKVGKVQLVVVSLSLIGLTILVISGFSTFDPTRFKPAFTHGSTGLFSAIAFVYISYAGVTKVAAIAEEIKNPDKNLPLAMLFALILIGSIYSLVAISLVGNIPVDQLKTDIHPIYTFAHTIGGKTAGIAAAILGVVTLISMANSGVLAASRFPFAMSRDRLLPEFMSKVHPRFLTPIMTIFLTCAAMALVILLLDVEKIAKLASAFMVTMFILVNICVIILRETSVQWYSPSYRSPLYPFMQLFGILSGFVLLGFLGLFPILSVIAIFVIGFLIYYFYGRNKADRSGVLKLYGHRPALFLLYHKSNTAAWKSRTSSLPEKIMEANLDGALAIDASVVVPMFGKERSAEMLVEMGAALSVGKKLQVVHLTEVPDQTMLDALLEDDVYINSLNRRISAMAQDKKVNVDFDAAVTHELAKTMQAISNQTHCKWMVMGWNGRERNGILIHNPIGWLLGHLNCNFALFKDRGIRYIRKIIVCSRPGRNDPNFIAAALQIANFYQAELTLCRVVSPSLSAEEVESIRHLSEVLLENCMVTGGKVIVLQGDDPIKTIGHESSGYDLMITGTPGKNFKNIWVGTGRDKFTEAASCSVLRLTIH